MNNFIFLLVSYKYRYFICVLVQEQGGGGSKKEENLILHFCARERRQLIFQNMLVVCKLFKLCMNKDFLTAETNMGLQPSKSHLI